jgi:polyhydroxybutyrate depolymerase
LLIFFITLSFTSYATAAKIEPNLPIIQQKTNSAHEKTTTLPNNGQTIYGTIQHDGIQREYILYIPDIYTGEDLTPLILNFHGYTSSAEAQMNYADFRPIADTAGFLVIHPQGTEDNLGNPHWNVGAPWHPGGEADDIGFTSALIDHIESNYTIDLSRIYATGMSNGGYFSFHLAGLLSHRIAAIAPVAGTMTTYTYSVSNPTHPTPVLQTHGTSDFIVPYNGNSWSLSVDAVLQYWITYNNCSTIPTITELPDIDPNDGSTVTQIIYADGDKDVTVEHFRVNGGGHTWPGSPFGGNQDINVCEKIWHFFQNYSLDKIYVDDNAEPSWYDATHVKTIQEGINNATTKDTVYVYNGTYNENINIHKTVTLIGEHKDTTIINGQNTHDVLTINAKWTNISGFTIQNSGTTSQDAAIDIQSTLATITDNTILNNNGITIRVPSNSNTITNNTLIKTGLLLEESSHNTILNNLVNNKPLIYLQDTSDHIISDAGQIILINCDSITIEKQDLSNTTIGIQLMNTNNCIIEKNKISSNTHYGIYLKDSNSNSIYKNNFIDNTQNAYDDNTNNWDNGKYGNYWSDYEIRYPNAKKLTSKGIWDTPYDIPTGTNKDHYPLLNQWPHPTLKIYSTNHPFLTLLKIITSNSPLFKQLTSNIINH